MKINVSHTTRISAEIDAAEGRARVNTISAERLQRIAQQAENALAATGLPLAELKGARYEFRDAGPSANSYRYSQGSTRVVIERGSRNWYLIAVSRDSVFPRQRALTDLSLTPAQKDAAVRRFADSLRVYRTVVPQQQPAPMPVSIATDDRAAA